MERIFGTNADGHLYYIILPIIAVFLLFFLKGRRKKFVTPTALMGIIIANPMFQNLWTNKLKLGYYWRILWIVPVIPLVAAFPAMLSEKISNKNIKGIVAIICVAVLCLCGSFIYNDIHCRFVFPATNYAKLPQEVVDIAEFLLNKQPSPRVIADRAISIYLRQYTGNIYTLYARDIDGYIYGPSQSARMAHNEIGHLGGDMSIVADIMRNEDYTYLVMNDLQDHPTLSRVDSLIDGGLIEIGRVGVYGIYVLKEQT